MDETRLAEIERSWEDWKPLHQKALHDGFMEAKRDIPELIAALREAWADHQADVDLLNAQFERVVAERIEARDERDRLAEESDLYKLELDAADAVIERVKALADEWADDYPGACAACNRTPDEWWRELRAALADPEPGERRDIHCCESCRRQERE